VVLRYGRSLNNTTPLGNYHLDLKKTSKGGLHTFLADKVSSEERTILIDIPST